MVITGDAATVLLVHPPRAAPETCTTVDGDAETIARLNVTFEGPAVIQAPDGTDIIGVTAVGSSIEPSAVPRPDAFDGMVAVETVEDPTDLSSVGVKVSSFCDQWGSEHVALSVCVHSLEALIETTSRQTAFEFTRLLLERLRSIDATAHMHLDPSATDGPTVETFEPLFDEVEVAGLGAASPEEREGTSRPRFGRTTATDTEIAARFKGDEDAAAPTTPDRPASDDEIAERLGDGETANGDSTPTPTPRPASDDEIAANLYDGTARESPAPVDRDDELSTPPTTDSTSDDEIAERLAEAGEPDTEELLEVEIDETDVSEEEVESRIDEWRDE